MNLHVTMYSILMHEFLLDAIQFLTPVWICVGVPVLGVPAGVRIRIGGVGVEEEIVWRLSMGARLPVRHVSRKNKLRHCDDPLVTGSNCNIQNQQWTVLMLFIKEDLYLNCRHEDLVIKRKIKRRKN